MPTTIDFRDQHAELSRDRLFDDFDDLEAGDTVTITADRDIDSFLYRYQVKRDAVLQWESERTGPESWEIQAKKEQPEETDTLTEFDVRDMPPQQRHTVLLDTFDSLDPGEGFVLVNDHDPKPLYYEIKSTRGDSIEWEYVARDAGEWKVEIRKTESAQTPTGDVLATFDVREIPKQDRHSTIHHRYGMIPDGETIEVIAPHEPQPLQQEFTQRYGDSFSWEVVDQEVGRCRVHITKTEEVDAASAAGGSDSGTHHGHGEVPALSIVAELDVRDLPPAQRHEQIFEKYADLQQGEAFVLVNDHDPKPLYHQFDAEAGEEFHWEYKQKEPGEFRVGIGKEQMSGCSQSANEQPDAPF